MWNENLRGKWSDYLCQRLMIGQGEYCDLSVGDATVMSL